VPVTPPRVVPVGAPRHRAAGWAFGVLRHRTAGWALGRAASRALGWPPAAFAGLHSDRAYRIAAGRRSRSDPGQGAQSTTRKRRGARVMA
jgi:hypothetical protein